MELQRDKMTVKGVGRGDREISAEPISFSSHLGAGWPGHSRVTVMGADLENQAPTADLLIMGVYGTIQMFSVNQEAS